jgi:two-component system LytT family response regulator
VDILRCIIVEDEYPAREELKYFINNYSSIEITEEFDDSLKALKFLENNKVDLIFLDINIPNLDGMSLGKIINKFEDKPDIVFITAYKEYALEAFEIQAVDYILKPYSEDRIINTLKRLEKKFNEKQEKRENNGVVKSKITLWKDGKMIVVNVNDIYYCETKERETLVYTEDGEYVANMNITSFLKELPQERFFRSHRSYIINIDKVEEIIPWFNNTYNVKLKDLEVEIPVSRSNVKKFRKMMRI